MTKNKKWFLYLVIVIFIVLGLFIIFSIQIPRPKSLSQNKISEPNLISDFGSLPPWGNPQAPVKIVEYGDFHCPFCTQAVITLYPYLEKLINEGKVVLYFRDFPIKELHPTAYNVHLASRCANEQNRYWDFHKKALLDYLSGLGTKTGELNYLLNLAESLNLNTTSFMLCYQSRRYEPEIIKDLTSGFKLNVRGTPTFFINGKMVEGLDPKSIIDLIKSELNQK